MKTIAELQMEIERIEEKHKNRAEYRESELKAAGTKCAKYRQMIHYLEAGATEESVSRQLQDAKDRAARIEAGYPQWVQFAPDVHKQKNPEAFYKREMGMPQINEQIRTLQYLLS